MEHQFGDGSKHAYCVLGPHRLYKKGHRLGASHIYEAFKAYVGDSWTLYHTDGQLCEKCHGTVRNLGKKLGIETPGRKTKTVDKESGAQVAKSVGRREKAAGEVEESVHEEVAGDVEESVQEEVAGEVEKSVQEEGAAEVEELVQGISAAQQEEVHDGEMASLTTGRRDESDGAMEEAFGSEIYLEHVNGLVHENSESTTSEDSQDSSVFAAGQDQRSNVMLIKNLKTMCKTGQNNCLLCNEPGRKRVLKSAVVDMWQKRRVFIPLDLRCCKEHYEGDKFKASCADKIEGSCHPSTCSLENVSFFEWIQEVTRSRGNAKYDFGNDGVPADKYPAIVAITKDQFDDLFSYIEAHLRNSCNRSKRNALAMWLNLMKSGNTQEHIALDFDTDQRTVSNCCTTVGELIFEHFTPKFLGFLAFDRQDLIQHHNRETTQIALSIPKDSLILIADGTYIHTDKPMDHEEQRLSFNAQKMGNFHRTMMFTTCSGLIVDCIGSFAATWNDSKCIEYILEQTGFKQFIGVNGHLLLDRGFKTAESALREAGITVHSPEWLGVKEKQFTTEKAGKSRLVTMNRWPVEGANGRVKQKFRFFLRKVQGRYSPSIPTWFKNCCALINKYGKPGFTETARNVAFAKQAVEKSSTMENQLLVRIEEGGRLRLSKTWKKLTGDELKEFPRIDNFEELEQICVGPYQMSQALLYIREHKKLNGSFELRFHLEFPDVVRTQIHSRFQSAKTHSSYIEFVPNSSGRAGIKAYYCTCRAGARVVGCCAHVATIIRYLAYERYQSHDNERMSKRVKFLGIEGDHVE